MHIRINMTLLSQLNHYSSALPILLLTVDTRGLKKIDRGREGGFFLIIFFSVIEYLYVWCACTFVFTKATSKVLQDTTFDFENEINKMECFQCLISSKQINNVTTSYGQHHLFKEKSTSRQ